MSEALDLAEYYVIDLGWPVFPLAPGRKTPATDRGFLDATRDLDKVHRWWRAGSRYGLAIACVGFVVVDVDVRGKKGEKPGRESLAELEAEHGPLPATWTVRTPSGGSHRYFANAGHVPRSIGVRPGIDLCGVGGFVAAPPTTTSEGAYAWEGDDVGLAALPAWVATLAKREPAKAVAPSFSGRWGTSTDLDRRIAAAVRYVDKADPSISGSGGHDRAWLVARALIHKFELPHAIALEVLRVFNQRCEPPWSERELAHKLVSAAAARVLPEPAHVVKRRA